MRDDEQDPPPYLGSYGINFERIGGTWYSRINATGEIIEVSARTMSAEEWDTSPQAKDPMWRPLRFGGLVMAVKIL